MLLFDRVPKDREGLATEGHGKARKSRALKPRISPIAQITSFRPHSQQPTDSKQAPSVTSAISCSSTPCHFTSVLSVPSVALSPYPPPSPPTVLFRVFPWPAFRLPRSLHPLPATGAIRARAIASSRLLFPCPSVSFRGPPFVFPVPSPPVLPFAIPAKTQQITQKAGQGEKFSAAAATALAELRPRAYSSPIAGNERQTNFSSSPAACPARNRSQKFLTSRA